MHGGWGSDLVFDASLDLRDKRLLFSANMHDGLNPISVPCRPDIRVFLTFRFCYTVTLHSVGLDFCVKVKTPNFY